MLSYLHVYAVFQDCVTAGKFVLVKVFPACGNPGQPKVYHA